MFYGRSGAYDLLGAALITLFVTWNVVSALVREGNPWPTVMTAAAATAGYIVGRLVGGRRPVFVAAAVVVSILIGTALSGPAALTGGAVAPPLGYANANGALFTLGVAAACMVAVCANKEPVRRVAGVLAVVLLGLTVFTLSKTAVVLSTAILVVAIVAHRVGRWVAFVGPAVILATVAVTTGLGLTQRRLPPLLDQLSERRTMLWREALEMAADQPVFGVGPGMFAQNSPTAMEDADASWAHSEYLEVAAETGVVGVALLALLLLWVFGALYRSKQDERLIVIGTFAVTALAVHATIDYVGHFPAVVIVAALLAGLASSRAVMAAETDR